MQVGGWRQKKTHYSRGERARRLQHQLARQDQAVQQRRHQAGGSQPASQPRSVQRRQSRSTTRLDWEPAEVEMWEDQALHLNNFPLMLGGAGARYGQTNMLLGLRQGPVLSHSE